MRAPGRTSAFLTVAPSPTDASSRTAQFSILHAVPTTAPAAIHASPEICESGATVAHGSITMREPALQGGEARPSRISPQRSRKSVGAETVLQYEQRHSE